MSEPAPSLNSVQEVPSSRDYSPLAMLLLGPFYMAYKGFLKEGLVFGFFTTILSTLIVDFGIEPDSEKMGIWITQGISGLFYLLAAFNWDVYLSKWNTKTGPNKFPRVVNLLIMFFFILMVILGISMSETALYESQLEEVKILERNGKGSEALGKYFELCRKETAEACFLAGKSLAESNMHDKSVRYWKKGCRLQYADACFEAAVWFKSVERKDMADNYLRKACSLGKQEACK